ncbi:hypothetical protein I589_00001, partial [Enterococcus phoeniculicola ATCC BAA-412]
YVRFSQGKKLFKRVIVVPYNWDEKKISNYICTSFQQVELLRISLVESGWIPNEVMK